MNQMSWLNLRRVWKYCGIFIEILFQKWRCRNLGELESLVSSSVKGKTILITGPTSGIGKAASWALAKKGAHSKIKCYAKILEDWSVVVLACRNKDRGESLKGEFLKTGELQNLREMSLEVVQLDVSDLNAIKKFVEEWRKEDRLLDILINNAGIFDIGSRKTNTDGMELHLLTNYLGPFTLTLGLLPCLQKQARRGKDCRIVNVSSTMHELTDFDLKDPFLGQEGVYSSDRAYAQSKLAMISFSGELQRRLSWTESITVCSLHPGEAVTEVARGIPFILRWVYKTILSWILFTPQEGARSVVYCATSEQVIMESRQHEGYFGSNCVPEKPSLQSQDREFARSLWDWSAGIVCLPAGWDVQSASRKAK